MKRTCFALSVACLFAAGIAGEIAIASFSPVKAAPPGAGLFAALGGLRSAAAEIVWFRMDALQEKGRYAELVQLSSLLTYLEPHESEVWIYSAWNLAYNVSVRMPREEDRWPWIEEALRLLRDRGLKWNPGSAALYRDLAFMFELKIGADIDSAAPHYRAEWKKTVEDVMARNAWSELAMEPAEMEAVEKEYGVEDWLDPQSSAIYWARLGLVRSTAESLESGSNGKFLAETLRQAKVLYDKNHGG